MRIKLAFMILLLFFSLFFSSCIFFFDGNNNWNFGTEITSIVIREKAGLTTQNYPLTFGHVFRRGDVPAGRSVGVNSGGISLQSQFEVKSSYHDGSVRHAVISVLIPQITANTDITLSLIRGSGNNGQGMDKNSILATDIGASLELTGLSGTLHSGNLTADLREAILQSDYLDYWLWGDVCTEIIVRQDLSESLNALWEVRFYLGTQYIRISHTIENINFSTRGNINYTLSINQGNADPSEVYSKSDFQHNHSSRWRKVFWLGEEPPEVEIRFDLPYMISTGMILPYDTSLEINETAINSNYSSWNNSNRDIMGNGTVHRYMPDAGGRADIGMLPRWTALYLLTMDNRMREVVLGNGEMSAHIPIHFREDDPGRSFYGHVVSLDDRPTFYWLNNYNYQNQAIGVITNTNWWPDMAHQPSLVYIPYLITGDRFYLDELYYWAAFNLFFAGYRTPGAGYGTGLNESYGRISGELRGVAWGLRTLSDAAAMAPDSDIEKNYFKTKLINNMNWLAWRNDSERGHGLNAVIWSGSSRSNDWPGGLMIAPWMHDFLVLSVSHIARQHTDIREAAVLRDNIGRFTINRFIELPPFRAAGYWWPLTDKSEDYYSDGNWTRYWTDIAEYTNNSNPGTAFTGSDYAYSYSAIALGASGVLTHLPRGWQTYNFLRDNLNYNTWARNDPTWSFSP